MRLQFSFGKLPLMQDERMGLESLFQRQDDVLRSSKSNFLCWSPDLNFRNSSVARGRRDTSFPRMNLLNF